MWRAGTIGLGAGVAFAVYARLLMRLASAEPEFTWSGTAGIVVALGLAGLWLGLVRGARLTGRSAGWRWLAVLALPMFGAQGGVLLPAALLGGWATAGRGPRWLRAVAGFVPLVVVPVGLFWLEWSNNFPLLPSEWRQAALQALAVMGMSVPVALGWRELFRRWP